MQDDASVTDHEQNQFLHSYTRIGILFFNNLILLLMVKNWFVPWDVFFCNFITIFLGIGMDSSVTPLRHGGLSLVQTTDFFYPLVDDPYMQGKIAI